MFCVLSHFPSDIVAYKSRTCTGDDHVVCVAWCILKCDRISRSNLFPFSLFTARGSNISPGYIHFGYEYMLFHGWKVCLVLIATNFFVSECRHVAKAVLIDAGRGVALMEYLARPCTVLLFSQRSWHSRPVWHLSSVSCKFSCTVTEQASILSHRGQTSSQITLACLALTRVHRRMPFLIFAGVQPQ